MKTSLPAEVPPRGDTPVRYTLRVDRAGPFEQTVPLYLDDGGLREVRLSIRGEAAQPTPSGRQPLAGGATDEPGP